MQVLSTFELDELSVVAVGAGAQHSIVAAGDALFVWGNNKYGQLGCGELHEKPVCSPMMLRWLENVTVTQLTCGDHHSIVVTNQSTVYAWGCNEKGQLGLGDTKLRSRPVRVDRLWGIPIVNVAAGGEHSLAVTTNGMLFTWGSNSNGQLGHPFNVEEAEEIHKRCASLSIRLHFLPQHATLTRLA
jgi:alpha-tubulin suppressor-like RCC1 family protein